MVREFRRHGVRQSKHNCCEVGGFNWTGYTPSNAERFDISVIQLGNTWAFCRCIRRGQNCWWHWMIGVRHIFVSHLPHEKRQVTIWPSLRSAKNVKKQQEVSDLNPGLNQHRPTYPWLYTYIYIMWHLICPSAFILSGHWCSTLAELHWCIVTYMCTHHIVNVHVREYDLIKLNVLTAPQGTQLLWHIAFWANKIRTAEQVPSGISAKSVSRRVFRLMPEPGIEPGTFRSSV